MELVHACFQIMDDVIAGRRVTRAGGNGQDRAESGKLVEVLPAVKPGVERHRPAQHAFFALRQRRRSALAGPLAVAFTGSLAAPLAAAGPRAAAPLGPGQTITQLLLGLLVQLAQC